MKSGTALTSSGTEVSPKEEPAIGAKDHSLRQRGGRARPLTPRVSPFQPAMVDEVPVLEGVDVVDDELGRTPLGEGDVGE